MRRRRAVKPVRLALAALALVVVLLGLAQLLLPGIAADRISSKLARYGKVDSVSVSAWPAVKLLWGDADSVRVRAQALALSPDRAASLLAEASGASRLDVTVQKARLGSVQVDDAALHKRGSRVVAEATITRAEVAAALPGVRVRLLPGAPGSVRVRVGASLFGLSGSVDAVASTSSGQLVVRQLGGPLGALHLTLFSNRHVYLDGVAVRELDTTPPAFRVSVSGRLR